MNLSEYNAILMQWRIKYGVPPPTHAYGLTIQSIACVKKGCGTTKRTQRHHTGNDFWFACLLPDHFAVRYMQFRSEDTAYLCPDHHKAAHKVYKKLVDEMKEEMEHKIMTKERAEMWMQTFRATFKRWVNKPAHRRKRRGSTSKPHEIPPRNQTRVSSGGVTRPPRFRRFGSTG